MLIQISSGKSPLECEYACRLFLKELLKEYGVKIFVVSASYRNKECLRSAVLYTELDLSELDGSIQWICQSPFRPHHKRKNWFVDVSVLKEYKEKDTDNLIRYEVCHSRGKGGQNVNKVSTAVRATHIPTGISVVVMEQRSQLQNKKLAYIRLMEKLKEKASQERDAIEYQNWNEHNQLQRGNPVRIYKGLDFKRMK